MSAGTSPFGYTEHGASVHRKAVGRWVGDYGNEVDPLRVTPVRTLAADEVAVHREDALVLARSGPYTEAEVQRATFNLRDALLSPAEPTPQPALTADQARRMAEGAQRIYDARHPAPAEPTAEDEWLYVDRRKLAARNAERRRRTGLVLGW